MPAAANMPARPGGIEIGVSPRISTPPPGVKRFFEAYPFVCLEQEDLGGGRPQDADRWTQVVEALPTYLDPRASSATFPGDGPGSLTSPPMCVDHRRGELRDSAGNRPAPGKGTRPVCRRPQQARPLGAANDLTARKLAALEAHRRGQRPLGAIASLDLDQPMRLPTSALIDWYLVAKRLADLPNRPAWLAAAAQELRNRLAYQGGRLASPPKAATTGGGSW